MSECVVRMEMPQNCCECQLRKEDYDTGEEFCPFTGVECLSIGRQNNCPILCQLPEGHGRLVDMRDIDSMMENAMSTSDESGLYSLVYRDDLDFDGLPTIVPAEEPPKEDA